MCTASQNKTSQDAAAISRTNASLAPDGIVSVRGQIVVVPLEDSSTVLFHVRDVYVQQNGILRSAKVVNS